MRTLPDSYYINGSSIVQSEESDLALEDDPRGILWLWDEPRKNATYILGCDPTEGITGWSRHTKLDDDHKVDNAVIQVFEINAESAPSIGRDGKPEIGSDGRIKFQFVDVQVAEFAAPIDPVEIARVIDVVGRLFPGVEEDMCEAIVETYPGPGMLTLQELLRLGYTNLWQWERIADGMAEQTRTIGWHSNVQSQRVLWTRARRHLMQRKVRVRSKWLLDEYSNAVVDPEKMRAKAAYGFHDDRIQAASMCFWAGHKWTYDEEPTVQLVTQTKEVDFQRLAPTLDSDFNYRDFKSSFFD